MSEYKIPLQNKKKEFVGDCLVSEQDYEELNKIKWSLLPESGYIQATLDNKKIKIHRYIVSVLMNEDINEKTQVIYLNKNKFDNRRENLKIVPKDCSLSKMKYETKYSKYNYVSFHKSSEKWVTLCNELTAYFDNENDAAYQANIWINENNLDKDKLNDVQPSPNFVPYIPKKTNIYPKGISFSNNKYIARICVDGFDKKLGYFNTLDEAIQCRKAKEEEVKKEKKEAMLKEPIKRNNDGECIIDIKSDNQLIVDEDKYYDLKMFSWHINKNGHVYMTDENKKHVMLDKFLLEYDGNDVINHIDGNKLNNKISNLRIITKAQSAMSRKSAPNSSTQYIGVSFTKQTNKWKATIQVDKKAKHLGFFDTEIEAAKARDIATKEYYGEFGTLNFPNVE